MPKDEGIEFNSRASTRIFLVDTLICNYISNNWIDASKSDRENAKCLGIHHNLIAKIKKKDGYKMPVSTLAIICFNKEMKTSKFFKLLEDEYGDKINDDFLEKPKK